MSDQQHTRRTALAMLAAFAENPGYRYTSREMRAAVTRHGGRSLYLVSAAKYLRDRGVKVDASRRRHHSRWWLASSAEELQAYEQRVVSDFYSEAATIARMTYGTAMQEDSLRTAIVIGGLLNLPVTEVVAACQPKPADLP